MIDGTLNTKEWETLFVNWSCGGATNSSSSHSLISSDIFMQLSEFKIIMFVGNGMKKKSKSIKIEMIGKSLILGSKSLVINSGDGWFQEGRTKDGKAPS